MSNVAPGGDLVVVTGASGFVGAAIARIFRRARFRVRAFVRASSPRTNLDPADDIAVGDMLDRASVAQALKGARYLVHAAADYRLWAPSLEQVMRANVEGTRTIMEEAQRAEIERVVYTSSVATIDLRAGGIADETRFLPSEFAIGTYKRSKTIAESIVIEMAMKRGLPAVIVNPSTPIGPRDVRPTPTGRIIIEAASGRMPAFVNTGLNFAHVDDVAAGHLAALQRGRVGERYILGGENVMLRQMLIDIAEIVGRRGPIVGLPRASLFPVAFVSEQIARLTGREPFATRDGLRMAKYTMHFDDSKARRELGYKSRPYREALVEAIDWFIQAGYLKRPRRMPVG